MRTTKKNKIKCQGECKRELSEERFYKSKSCEILEVIFLYSFFFIISPL